MFHISENVIREPYPAPGRLHPETPQIPSPMSKIPPRGGDGGGLALSNSAYGGLCKAGIQQGKGGGENAHGAWRKAPCEKYFLSTLCALLFALRDLFSFIPSDSAELVAGRQGRGKRLSGCTPASKSVGNGLRNPIGDSAGLTLIEIIMVITLVGILVVVAAPKFLETGGFSLEGAAAMVAADLRHAQALAMATHDSKEVRFVSGTPPPTVTYDVETENDLFFRTVKLPSEVSIDTTVTFTFNSLGEPSTSVGWSMTISAGANNKTISVTQYTGKVTIS